MIDDMDTASVIEQAIASYVEGRWWTCLGDVDANHMSEHIAAALAPHPDIGQPCSGEECAGRNDLCPDCQQSYQDHRDSFRPMG